MQKHPKLYYLIAGIIIALFQSLLIGSLLAQFDCKVIPDSTKSSGDIPNSSDYIPNSNTPIKIIRVNIHFMLKSIGDPGYPGNFTKTSDGAGNTNYTGYDYAEDLIETANTRLSSNVQMKMPPGNNTSVLERKYQYILNGVFFHADNNYYYYNSDPSNTYGENIGECINVFLDYTDNGIGGGNANMSGNRRILLKGTWERYLYYLSHPDEGNGIWAFAGTLNHEVGHNLSLHHTMRYDWGPCYDYQEDYCSDTPTRKEIKDVYGFDPCCGWGGGENCTNNLMDYSGEDAITPQQLGREHWTIENEIFAYKSCHYNSTLINISSFTENKSYISKNIIIPASASVTVNNNNALFINCEEFDLKGELEIKKGSLLIVNPVNNCNSK